MSSHPLIISLPPLFPPFLHFLSTIRMYGPFSWDIIKQVGIWLCWKMGLGWVGLWLTQTWTCKEDPIDSPWTRRLPPHWNTSWELARGLQRVTRRGPWQTEMISTAFIVGNMLLLLIYSILPLFPMPPLPSPVPSEAPHGVPPHKALQVLEYVAKTSMLVPCIVALHCAMSTLVCSFYLLQQTYIGIVRPLLSLSCLSLFYAWHWKVLSKAFAVRY